MKKFFKSIYSPKAIYELRKIPVWLTTCIALIFGILHMAPFTISFLGYEPYRMDRQVWNLSSEEQEAFIHGLPSHCYILNNSFVCDVIYTYNIRDDISIHINNFDTNLINGIMFMENQVYLRFGNQNATLYYNNLNGIDFGELQQSENGFDHLFDLFATDMRALLVIPFVLGSYQTGIVSYFMYITIISALAMVLKFGHTHFINYKEMLNIMVFSSFLPIVIVNVIGLITTPAFTTIIFNMGTPLWAYVIYKKQVIPGLVENAK